MKRYEHDVTKVKVRGGRIEDLERAVEGRGAEGWRIVEMAPFGTGYAQLGANQDYFILWEREV